jgi:hypothetical protein
MNCAEALCRVCIIVEQWRRLSLRRAPLVPRWFRWWRSRPGRLRRRLRRSLRAAVVGGGRRYGRGCDGLRPLADWVCLRRPIVVAKPEQCDWVFRTGVVSRIDYWLTQQTRAVRPACPPMATSVGRVSFARMIDYVVIGWEPAPTTAMLTGAKSAVGWVISFAPAPAPLPRGGRGSARTCVKCRWP